EPAADREDVEVILLSPSYRGVVRLLPRHFGVSDTAVSAIRRLATSDALVRLVRPFELHSVGTELPGLPGADVADLAIGIVVPPLSRNGIGIRLAQLVRAGGRQRVEHREAARTVGAARIGHDGIEHLRANGVVVAAERLTGR